MKIELTQITIRELVDGYVDNADKGVRAYAGRLDVRPPYQRESVYDERKREAVLRSVRKGYPLNTMYWCDHGDGTYEIIDGQQRTISVCQYVTGVFAMVDPNNREATARHYFGNLPEDQQRQILDYPLFIYLCSGTQSEKLDWFETINVVGVPLTRQEIRNAVYTSAWLTDARAIFSKRACPAARLASKLLDGDPTRQAYLETVLRWMGHRDNLSIEDLMARDSIGQQNAGLLWAYFRAVIDWTNCIFSKYRKEMKGIEWGLLYNEYHDREMNPVAVEEETARLMADSDVKSKRGIYRYIFTHDEHDLDIRAFDNNMRREAYERQGGICARCGRHFDISEMEADHITPWAKGGHTTADNCQMLCRDCNRRKSDS